MALNPFLFTNLNLGFAGWKPGKKIRNWGKKKKAAQLPVTAPIPPKQNQKLSTIPFVDKKTNETIMLNFGEYNVYKKFYHYLDFHMRPVPGYVAKFCQNLVPELDRVTYISTKITETDWRFLQTILMRFTQLPTVERIVGTYQVGNQAPKPIDFIFDKQTRKCELFYSDTKNFLSGFKLLKEDLDDRDFRYF